MGFNSAIKGLKLVEGRKSEFCFLKSKYSFCSPLRSEALAPLAPSLSPSYAPGVPQRRLCHANGLTCSVRFCTISTCTRSVLMWMSSLWNKDNVKCTLVQALRLCTGRTAHRGLEIQLYPFMTTALEGGEWSVSRTGRSLPPGKTRYPLYRRLGGPQGRSGQVRNISPPHRDSIPGPSSP
jgi:hypothetical protein